MLAFDPKQEEYYTDLDDLAAGKGKAEKLERIVHDLMFRKYSNRF
jgi:hypothetical protein